MKEKLEGRQSILAALKAHRRKIELIMVSWSAHRDKTADVLTLATQQNIPVKTVSPEELDAAAKGRTHGGLIAICSSISLTTADELIDNIKRKEQASLMLLLEGVEDEQNLGFIIRSAFAFGLDAILLKKHIWNFDPLTLSRTSCGAYERLSLVKIEKESETLKQLSRSGLKIWGAIAGAKRTFYDMDFSCPCIIALGGEKRGLSAVVREQCDGFFRIPMPNIPGDDERPSLSLSHSAAIIMAEVMRQRLNGGV
ncbi:MAG: RNA methyltransferase [Planctomycetes bacterium]|nr:RNA methyltransferase [Planctomycetota bacterium]